MIIFDTDVLSIVQRGRGAEFQILNARLAKEPSPIFATIVSFEEQMRGWLAQIARVRALKQQLAETSDARHWVEQVRGLWAGDAIMKEITDLGREYRESLRPGAKKKPRRTRRKK